MRITLIPFDDVGAHTVEALADRLRNQGLEVDTGSTMTIPSDAYNGTRGQYRGESLLEALGHEKGDCIMGITAHDLYASALNFIFGLAQVSGRAGVISLYRLETSADQDQTLERATKEVIHELGHIWGLSHCPDPICVMHYSHTLADTDRKGRAFCQDCLSKLGA